MHDVLWILIQVSLRRARESSERLGDKQMRDRDDRAC